jgi:hypothetical protein
MIEITATCGIGGSAERGLESVVLDGWTSNAPDGRKLIIGTASDRATVAIVRGVPAVPGSGRAASYVAGQLALEAEVLNSDDQIGRLLAEVNDRLFTEMSYSSSWHGIAAQMTSLTVTPDQVIIHGVGDLVAFEMLSGILVDRPAADRAIASNHFGGLSDSLGRPWKWSDRREGRQRFLLTSLRLGVEISRDEVEKIMRSAPSISDCSERIAALASSEGLEESRSIILIAMGEPGSTP